MESLNANNHPAITDPFHLMVLEIVKLIQASLAMWGLFPYADGTGIDGMFCNDTKQAMEDWRAAVSWQEDDAVRKDVSLVVLGPACDIDADAVREKGEAAASSRGLWLDCLAR